MRVVNIAEPVDLYEVEPAGLGMRRQFFAESEAALEELESADFALAASRAGKLLLENPYDGPLLLLLSRTARPSCRATASSTRSGSRRGSERAKNKSPV